MHQDQWTTIRKDELAQLRKDAGVVLEDQRQPELPRMKPCLFCGSTDVQIVCFENFRLVCTCCRARGPVHGTAKAALFAWNKVPR